MRLVDSHCHLNADRFEPDADQVIGAARWPGSSGSWSPAGTSPRRNGRSRCVDRFPWLDAAVGIHPHDAAKVDDAGWARIVAWAPIRGSWRSARPASTTTVSSARSRTSSTNLRRNLALALETGKPAILHCRSADGRRDAQDALVAELRAAGVGGPAWAAQFGERPPAVIHSYSGPLDYAHEVIDLGLAISFSGLVFRTRRGGIGRRGGRVVPAERLLIETDSPFLSPPGAPRSRNAAGVGARHRGVGRGATGDDPRRARARPGRRLRPDLPESRRTS